MFVLIAEGCACTVLKMARLRLISFVEPTTAPLMEMSASHLVIALLGRNAPVLVLFVASSAARMWSAKGQGWQLLRLEPVVDGGGV
jgi:hypothetical protein